ncbi:hypothetical protein FBUS_05331 [Fasciolopsis buskii]|uniref:SHSP domain-containing protein n=1 Tax=Fasciolopsis buskii TaxID=27845 RepID=A0A8E0S2S7_9TREM|nr:hypothetical protein FBUS_05331 [Fasciolopsis buski]
MLRRFDERRRLWGEDVRRMRREFFTLSPRHHLPTHSSSPPGIILSYSGKLSSSPPFSASYETDSDGTVRFVANFDANGFAPENIKVTVRDDELLVTAQMVNKLEESSVMVRPKFRFELPIDSDYLPSKIQICTLNHQIHLNARHEEHLINRTALREFFKEYDIPDNVDPKCLEAKFENGILYIEAATN